MDYQLLLHALWDLKMRANLLLHVVEDQNMNTEVLLLYIYVVKDLTSAHSLQNKDSSATRTASSASPT
jgi:hypothetical protein